MLKINSLNSVNNITFKQSITEKNTQKSETTQTEISNVTPDFAVKTPLKYNKTGIIDFPFDTKAHCYKLSNGQKVVIIPQEGETIVKSYINTGSMNEPDNLRGISHFIEHNLFNGSDGLDEGDFFKQVNNMGASTNASTGLDQTNYYISSNLLDDKDLETKIKLHASMLETPMFAAEKLLKEKEIVNSEINMITSDPENIAINRMLKNLYGIKTTSEDIIGGTTDNINNITRDDVVNYFNNNYYPSNIVTVITGEVDPDKTIELISKYFSSTKQAPNNRHDEEFKPIEKPIREDIISDKATATSIVMGFCGPKSSDVKERVYTDALLTILSNSPSSKINNKIKKYAATSEAEDERISSNNQNSRAIIFSADSDESSSEKVLKEMLREIENIKKNPPTETELNMTKKLLLKGLSSIFENSHLTSDAIGDSFLDNNQDYIKNYENIINNMTSDDIVKTAEKYLNTNKVSIAVVHPNTATKESILNNYKSISFTGNVKKDAINMNKVKEYEFNNNYRLITNDTKTNNVDIYYKLHTQIDFKPKPACALVLEELLNEGNIFKNQEDLDLQLANEGILKSFSASNKNISCNISCDSENADKAIYEINNILENPRFLEADFELAKETIKKNIETSEKSASDKLNSELFKGLPKGYTKEELLESLKNLSLDDVKNLYQDIKHHSKGMIAISAPFSKNEELKNKIFNSISSLNNVKKFEIENLEKIYEPVNETKVLCDTDFKNQAEILMAYKFKQNNNIKDIATVNLLNIILGGNASSRLFNDLRENQKLAYHVKSNYKNFSDTGLLTLKILTTTDNKETGEQHFENIEKAIEGFKKHIQNLKSEQVTDEELRSAKLFLKNAILNSSHSNSGKNSALINSIVSPYGIDRQNQLLSEIDNITKEDIYNAANYILNTKPTYSILATSDTLKANENYLTSLKN